MNTLVAQLGPFGACKQENIEMSEGIEIYVRDSGDRTMLNIHVPDHLREVHRRAGQRLLFGRRGGDRPRTLNAT